MRLKKLIALGCVLAVATLRLAALDQVIITEFMAANSGTLQDEDGAYPDWIEIHNAGTNMVNLDGWSLTDDVASPAQWLFPSTNLAPNAYLVVFASGKNRRVPGAPLHTSFNLTSGGGFLALLKPGGVEIASQFFYGQQFTDVSFGTGAGPSRTPEPLVVASAPVKFLIPSAPVDEAWRGGAAFDDSSWSNGVLGLGFDFNAGPLTIAYSGPSNLAGNQAYGGALGMDFDVSQPVSVTELGCFDDSGNGIAAGVTITVQLWRRNNAGTPGVPTDDTGVANLASTNFTTASPGTLVGAHRFKALSTPLALTNGSYTIVAFGYGATERLANNIGGAVPNSGGGALSFVGRSRYGDNTSLFPGTGDAQVAQYGAGTFKFQAGSGLTFGTVLTSMRSNNASALFRVPFTVPPGANYDTLALNVSYDDGFAAFLNGVEMARRNAPTLLTFNATATNTASASESIDGSAFANQLVPGANVLSIHGLNVTAADNDFRINATLMAERTATNAVYFTTPTPGAGNGAGLLFPGVVINEIHSDSPNSKSLPSEFIELFNPLPSAVDISGWSFTRGITFTFGPGTSIPAGGFLVVAEKPSVFQQQFGGVAHGPWTGSLANDGETVELVDAVGALVDQVSYGLGFPWPTVGDNGYSMQLIHEGLDNDLGSAWRSASPTPGARNSVTTGHAPPLVRQVDHAPNQPRGGEVVTLTAKVTDADGVASVTLDYQVVLPGNYITLTNAAFATNWTSLPMHDDGMDGDAVARDGVFTAQIPAGIQQHRRLIRYRIHATDTTSFSVRVPYADDPSPNFAFFVYDGVPAWTGAVQPGVTPAQTFDTNTMRKVRAFHLLSRSNDVWNCQYNGAFNDGVYRFEGALVVDGKVYDHVFYRVKGQNSTYNTGKNKWKFKFNRSHWLELPDNYGQSKTIIETLNVSSLPSSWAPWNRGMAGLDEVMQYRLTELAGVPAPRTTYFQLRVIDDPLEQPATQYDGDFWGLYTAFENQDNRFKDAHDLPDGNIFRMQATSGGNRLLGQGAGQPLDLSDLRAFTSATTGYNFSPSQPEAWWRTNVDLPKYFSWRAVNEAVNNTDIRDQENVVYFRDPVTGHWHIEPWDCDLLYEQFDRWGPEATQSTAPYEQIRRCLLVANISVEFKNRARELQDLLLNSDQAWKLVDEYLSLITDGGATQPGFVEADRRRWDYNPINPVPPRGVGASGNYYKTPYPVPNMGLGPPQPFFRTLTSPDFAGLVTWVKNFIALDAHGGARLASLANDPTIPARPALSYLGPPYYPADGLVFQTTAFSSPTGRVFAAMQWRVGEVHDPGVPNFVAGQPWRYEIEEVWNSGELTSFNSQMTVPPEFIREGRTYRARVKFKDSGGRWSRWSEAVQFTAGSPGVAQLAQSLIVSELMYNPPALGAVSGDELEFIELKNVGPGALNVGGLTFTAGINFTFTNGTTLAAGATFLLARNPVQIAVKYPGVIVQGIYTGKLDNGGETLTLAHPAGGTVLSFTYDDELPWPVAPDNLGFSLVPVNANASFDHGNPYNWRTSSAVGGSPGGNDLAPPNFPAVLVNEVLANGAPPQVDAIELYNSSTNPADLGGWFLSDSIVVPQKFIIPPGTVLPGGGFLVFYANTSFGAASASTANGTNAFGLGTSGDGAFLFSGDGTNLTGYAHGFSFGASPLNVTYGRFQISTGPDIFVLQLSNTLGGSNSGPFIGPIAGPIVINEFTYDPASPNTSFIELLNTSSNLTFDLSYWQINGLSYTFPPGSMIGPRANLVLAADRTAFAAEYGATIPVFGTYSGTFATSGETITLLQPGPTQAQDVIVDRVQYENALPWSTNASGTGFGFQLIDPLQDNSRVGNWASSYYPGSYTPATNLPGMFVPGFTNYNLRFVSLTGLIGNPSRLLLYLGEIGEAYIDDLYLANGSVAEAGTNYITNGDFETPLPGAPALTNFFTSVGSYHTNSTLSQTNAHSGTNSLRIVSTNNSSFALARILYKDIPGPTNTQVCTLSFWYRPTFNCTNLFARFQSSTIGNSSIPAAILTPPFAPGSNLPSTFVPAITVPPTSIRTPGGANSNAAALAAFPPLWLNEVQAQNISGPLNLAGQPTAWFELYNAGPNVITLTNLFLSGNFTNLTNWAFPAGATIDPGEFKLIFADGLTGLSTLAELHTSFALPPGGGSLALSRLHNGQPQVIDYLNSGGLTAGRSFGSFTDGQSFNRQEFSTVTPRAPNLAGLNSAPVLATLPGTNVNAGALLTFTANATDTDVPAQTLNFSLSDQPPGASITTGGLFTWTPAQNQAPGTNAITVIVADSGTPSLTATQTFNVIIIPPPRNLTIARTNATEVVLTWQAFAGRSYRVEYVETVDALGTSWTPIGNPLTATGDTLSFTDPIAPNAQRFYRVRQLQP